MQRQDVPLIMQRNVTRAVVSMIYDYDKVSANVMISVQKMGESESGQIVF